MRPVPFCLFVFSSVLFVSCVSTGKFKAMEQEAQKNDSLYTWSQRTLKNCQDANTDLGRQKADLQDRTNQMNTQLTASQENITLLRKQLKDLSAISSSQAESIRKSMDNMGARDGYMQELRAVRSHIDSVNLAMVMNLKAYLGNLPDSDMKINVGKGLVSIDLSYKLLFNDDSIGYTVADKGKAVMGRLARVLNEQPDLSFMIEGHTDSIAYQQGELLDNWDLSVKRATSLVRMLQKDFNISPQRMTAAGRSEYITVATNDTPEGLAANRRIRVVIIPELEHLLELLERKQG